MQFGIATEIMLAFARRFRSLTHAQGSDASVSAGRRRDILRVVQFLFSLPGVITKHSCRSRKSFRFSLDFYQSNNVIENVSALGICRNAM